MRYVWTAIIAIITIHFVNAQTEIRPTGSSAQAAQNEINEQVWKPFIQSFNRGDDEGFKAVRSKEVIQVIQDGQEISGYEEDFQKVPDSLKPNWARWSKHIELRFIQRIAEKDRAFEVGYYKTVSTNKNTGASHTGYGKFHVLLRKEDGVWKILMDADAGDGTNDRFSIR